MTLWTDTVKKTFKQGRLTNPAYQFKNALKDAKKYYKKGKTVTAVLFDGQNVRSGDDVLKGRMGYLPEHNPLYPEMYVREFLDFIAGLHGVKGKAARAQKVEDTIKR